MRYFFISILILGLIYCQKQEVENNAPEKVSKEYANELTHKFILVDTHIDLPERLMHDWVDISKRNTNGHVDYERMVDGGLDAPFMAIYIPASYEGTGKGKALADSLIDMVKSFETRWPHKFKTVTTPTEVRDNFNKGIISLPMGIENGTAIEGGLSNLEHFYNRGVRYMTLTHSGNNLLGASSFDFDRTWDGLTEFGEKVIKEMNRLGMIVDVSHVSDSTFYDVLKITKTPPIASHSSCRCYTPGMERNMSDDMIKALADKGGVIMINFGTYFIDGEYRQKMDRAWEYVRQNKLSGEERTKFYEKFKKENNVPQASAKDVAQHIKHVVDLVGIDYVGIGSDFDGVGDLPVGLEDASKYPNLIYELLKMGFNEKDIEKICSKNILRVWQQVEDYAAEN